VRGGSEGALERQREGCGEAISPADHILASDTAAPYASCGIIEADDLLRSRELSQPDTVVPAQLIGKNELPTLPRNPSTSPAARPQLAPIRVDDLERMRQEFQDLLKTEVGDVRELGQELFQRIAIVNWSVEWNLPRWLAAESLTESQKRRLVVANVFGLGYVRLHDDRHDGEQTSWGRAAELRLEELLLEAARIEYRQLLGDSAWFWEQFDRHMLRWQQTIRSSSSWISGFNLDSISPTRLSDIGAPLLISCGAACMLAGNTSRLPAFEAPVRQYLAAAVLFDHLSDWQEDLAANRPNIFLEAMLAPYSGERDAASMLPAMYLALTGTEKVRRYVQLLLDQLEAGIGNAFKMSMRSFAQHLMALKDEASSSADLNLTRIEGMLAQAQNLLVSE